MKKNLIQTQYNICVAGAADTSHCGPNAVELASEVGREIVRQGGTLMTGATTGSPFWAAKGAKEEGGVSIGWSPATTRKEHVKVYKLPVDYFDIIVHTGAGYAGRNLLLTRSSDAVIIVCGRLGTLNEFTIAFEDDKPIGVLQGPWTTDEIIQTMVEQAHRGPGRIVYDAEPKKLVEKVIKLIEETKVE